MANALKKRGQDSPLDRRQRQVRRHRWDVVEAALDLFDEKGCQAAGMQEIARRAEFGVGTVYRLFPGGKQEILAEVRERVVLEMEKALASEAPPADPVEKVRYFIRIYTKVFAARPREMAAHLTAEVGEPHRCLQLEYGLEPEQIARIQPLLTVFREGMAQGVASGQLRDLPPAKAARSLEFLLGSSLLGWQEDRDQGRNPESLERTVGFVEELFFHGINQAS
ncbi:MAG: TetR/AcrR family transcriptional regulator [Deltaproteobacteria bacterium]|nr:TetR/AcrR family transcriptional regulator [Deltaproteobacteria bacterium]